MAKKNSAKLRMLAVSSAAVSALALQGCATAPGGGEGTVGLPATVQTISAKDKQQGAEAHPQLLAEFGGVVSGPQAT